MGTFLTADKVRVVEFQTTTVCNARCTICPWPEVRGAGRPVRMSDPVWERLLDDITELHPQRVIPYLNNEPLADPSLADRIVAIRKRLGPVEIEVSTNGLLLTEKKARALVEAGTTDLLISVFGHDEHSQRLVMGIDFARVRANVLTALRVRNELRAPTQICVIQVELPRMDPALLDASRLAWLDAGVDVLRYGYLDRAGNVQPTVAGMVQRDPSLTPRGCELRRHQERMYVVTDGTVIFCCHDWRVQQPIGNLMGSRLSEIWHSAAYRQLRERVEGTRPSDADFLCRYCKLCPAGEVS